jgi:type I restriction enzyme, R subunit
MTSPGRAWNESNLSEEPAVRLLQRLGWTYVAADVLDAERESFREVVLPNRLGSALRRLNPWISDDVRKAIRAITGMQAKPHRGE